MLCLSTISHNSLASSTPVRMSAAAKRKYNTIQLNRKLETISKQQNQRNLKKKKKHNPHHRHSHNRTNSCTTYSCTELYNIWQFPGDIPECPGKHCNWSGGSGGSSGSGSGGSGGSSGSGGSGGSSGSGGSGGSSGSGGSGGSSGSGGSGGSSGSGGSGGSSDSEGSGGSSGGGSGGSDGGSGGGSGGSGGSGGIYYPPDNNDTTNDGNFNNTNDDAVVQEKNTDDQIANNGNDDAVQNTDDAMNNNGEQGNDDAVDDYYREITEFDLQNCTSFNNYWLWDLALTCDSQYNLTSCECTSAAILMSKGLLQCPEGTEEAPYCPDNCDICDTCLTLLGCAETKPPRNPFRTRFDMSLMLYILAAVAGVLLGVIAVTVHSRKNHEKSLEENLVDGSSGDEPVWLAPVSD